MILLYLKGGIGNQMFQYAAAKALATHLSTTLKIDKSYYDEKHYEGDELTRYFNIPYFRDILHFFNITAPDATQAEINSIQLNTFQKIIDKLRPWHRRRKFIEIPGSDQDLFQLKSPVILKGHFQSEKFFAPYAEIIQSEFQFRKSIIDRNKKFAELIKSSNSVSIHIRRGDYVSHDRANQVLGALREDYYSNAKAYIENKLDRTVTYFVFSDEPQWAKENLQLFSNAYFIDNSSAETDVDEMYLMSLCSNQIIANSSFSWWAAWLNPNPDKIVIAPKKWFNNAPYDTRDLIPDSWIKI